MEFTRWADYSGGQLALADVDEKFATAYIDRLKAMGLVAGGSEKVTTARAASSLEPEFVEAQQTQLEAYARRKLLTARHEAFERDAAVISRELTRRVERDPSVRRTNRLGGAR